MKSKFPLLLTFFLILNFHPTKTNWFFEYFKKNKNILMGVGALLIKGCVLYYIFCVDKKGKNSNLTIKLDKKENNQNRSFKSVETSLIPSKTNEIKEFLIKFNEKNLPINIPLYKVRGARNPEILGTDIFEEAEKNNIVISNIDYFTLSLGASPWLNNGKERVLKIYNDKNFHSQIPDNPEDCILIPVFNIKS